MISTGVVAALASERRAFGRVGGSLVRVSGMGPAAAARAATALIDAGVSRLMTFGMAGGLDPVLETGQMLLPREIINSAGARFLTSAPWREGVAKAVSENSAGRVTACGGPLLTSPEPLDVPHAKLLAFRATGAVAVDMESAAVAQVAAAHALPFISVRVIVDAAKDVVPRSVIAASRPGGVQMGNLALNLARTPGDITAIIRLAWRYRTAMQALRSIASSLRVS